jgi:receptor expression-enhancing protein 1/2/3/4
MSFISVLSHCIVVWFAFLIPVFGTYKALSHRPVSEPGLCNLFLLNRHKSFVELERWTQYWAVIGVVVAYEYLAGTLVDISPEVGI